MHLGEISFCDRQGFNIKSDEAKQAILSSIESQYGIRIIQKHFEKFSDGSLKSLQASPHLVCLRTNGNPYFMFFTRHNSVNQAIFVDKKVQQGYFYPRMVLVRAWFNDSLFDGTLIDGEMVKDRGGKWRFVCSDLVALAGQHLTATPLAARISLLSKLFAESFMPDPDNDYCTFEVKRFWQYDQLEHVVTEVIPQLPYTVRGLLFKPAHLRQRDTLMNFDDSLVKKVVRVKYKSVSSFLTEDVATGGGSMGATVKQPSAAAPEGAAPAPVVQQHSDRAKPSPSGAPQPATKDTALMYARKTAKPDVFELYERADCSGDAHIAGMPTMAASKLMRALFAGKNAVERIPVVCEYSERFKKWIPKQAARAPECNIFH